MKSHNKLKISLKYLFLGCIGGSIYCILELMWRSWTHWTMFILGGICFIALGLINEIITWDMPLTIQMLIGCIIITTLEFITGCIVNLWLGWNVWNYTTLDFLGQISIGSSILWFFLSGFGIVLDDYIRYFFFGEKKPKYKIL